MQTFLFFYQHLPTLCEAKQSNSEGKTNGRKKTLFSNQLFKVTACGTSELPF